MPTKIQLQQNLRRYQLYNILCFTPFMLPVLVLFWQENGLDMFDIFLLQSIFAVAIVLLEVPTGMLADRLGKRASLIIGMGISSIGMVGYALGYSFASFLIAEMLLAVGASLHSGAGSALLYDTLKALGREDEFKQYEGRTRALQMVGFAVCNLIGGLVGSYSYRATIWLSVLGPVASLLVALTLCEVQQVAATGSWREGLAAYRQLIGQSLRFVSKHRLIRWQITFLAVLTGSSGWLLWQYQPYMEWSGLPVWAFGIAFTLFNLFAALMSHLAHRVDRLGGRTGTIAALMVLQVAPLVLLAQFIGPLSFLFILGHQAVRGLAIPIISDRILNYTYADKRATVLSIASMASRLFFATTSPLIGQIARQMLMPVNLLIQAVAISLMLGLLLVTYVRIPAKYFAVKTKVLDRQ